MNRTELSRSALSHAAAAGSGQPAAAGTQAEPICTQRRIIQQREEQQLASSHPDPANCCARESVPSLDAATARLGLRSAGSVSLLPGPLPWLAAVAAAWGRAVRVRVAAVRGLRQLACCRCVIVSAGLALSICLMVGWRWLVRLFFFVLFFFFLFSFPFFVSLWLG